MPSQHPSQINTPKLVALLLGAILTLLVIGLVVILLFLKVDPKTLLGTKSPQYSSQELSSQAAAHLEKGEYGVAESYLEQALLKENDATYRSNLAVVKYRLKKYEQAVAEYQRLIDQKHEVAFAWNGMGNAYRDWASEDLGATDKRKKAEEAYRNSFKANPQYVAAYSNLSLLLFSEGRTEEARKITEQGIGATNAAELKELLLRLR
ncbi:MAG: Tetratricopeptide 1 repeat-containing protein [Patescibacteria group bacterium]|jgi:tetratricopeptide (TPR) repeat protein|nr:Tetratricopeptide 1 repeat-containing protein [Patescibacteria group bacterium]